VGSTGVEDAEEVEVEVTATRGADGRQGRKEPGKRDCSVYQAAVGRKEMG